MRLRIKQVGRNVLNYMSFSHQVNVILRSWGFH